MIFLNTKAFGEISGIFVDKLTAVRSVRCQLNPDTIIFIIFAFIHQNGLDVSLSL